MAHDKHIAYVSHLSHISSFMLGKTVLEKEKNEKNIFDMAGSGFESTVRLAKSSPNMWSPIFIENKENILDSLNEYIDNLITFKNLIIEENSEGLQ
ncbi:prephenate dehydrogenase/arogenate dehydrogenase family protein, partial [Saccharophagus degradans]|nr:prephenate dehydrogenase/arogenate dehydrogenase family protein [Saccharophagus degradans]